MTIAFLLRGAVLAAARRFPDLKLRYGKQIRVTVYDTMSVE